MTTSTVLHVVYRMVLFVLVLHCVTLHATYACHVVAIKKMQNNDKPKSQRREDTKRNQGKMIVRGRSIFTLLRLKLNKKNR